MIKRLIKTMKKTPLLSDVAKLAKVSTATVSAVVNNQDGRNIRVSAETRARVLEAIEQLGYVANPAARILAKGENKLIGIFTYEPIFPFKHHDFFYPFLLGIEEEAEVQGYNLLLFTNVTNADGSRSIYHGGTNQLVMADGSILLGLNENKEELKRLDREGHPFVYVGRREISETKISFTAADYTAATCQLTDLMLDLGHRKLIYVCMPHKIESNEDREDGFKLALQRRGLPVSAEFTYRIDPRQISVELMQKILAEGVSGAVVENDTLASAMCAALSGLGLSVPNDFSIVLCGDPHYAWDNSPDWTMFTIPRREMGQHAVRLLVKQLQSPQVYHPEEIYLPCTIIPGHTIAPPALARSNA